MRWNSRAKRAAAAGIILTGIWGLAVLAPAQDEVIVETRPGGKNAEQYQELEGLWSDSESKAMLTRLTSGLGSRYATVTGTSDTIKAVFKPVVPSAGEWDIQVAWGKSGNAGPVTYTVQIGDLTEKKELTQAGWGGLTVSNSDKWHSLGAYNLAEGQSVSITVDGSTVTANPDSRNAWRVYADALRLVKPGSEAAQSSVYDATMATPTMMASTTVATGAPISASGTRMGDSPFLTGQPAAMAAAAPATEAPYVTTTTESDTPFVPSSSSAPAMESVNWLTDYRQAVTQGIQEGRPILLFFHVPGQQETQRLEGAVLADANVQAALAGYVLCKVRLGDNPALDAHYKADQAPILYFLNRSGVSQARAVGVIGAGSLAQALQKYK